MADNQTLDMIVEDAMPVLLPFGSGRWAVTIGGSHGKGLGDHRSDVDFRLYADEILPRQGEEYRARCCDLYALMERWRDKGVEIDGVWLRSFAEIDWGLDEWLSGKGKPDPKVWSVWGYLLPTDIYNQLIIKDPWGIAEGWKQRMKPYPAALRDAILKEHLESLKYWRADYHYASKVARKDIVFLASLTAHLTHDVMQVLFALNGMYFPGDGLNLQYPSKFGVRPDGLEERVAAILLPGRGEDSLNRQYSEMKKLIDDVIALADAGGMTVDPE